MPDHAASTASSLVGLVFLVSRSDFYDLRVTYLLLHDMQRSHRTERSRSCSSSGRRQRYCAEDSQQQAFPLQVSRGVFLRRVFSRYVRPCSETQPTSCYQNKPHNCAVPGTTTTKSCHIRRKSEHSGLVSDTHLSEESPFLLRDLACCWLMPRYCGESTPPQSSKYSQMRN